MTLMEASAVQQQLRVTEAGCSPLAVSCARNAAVLRTAYVAELPLQYQGKYLQASVGLGKSWKFIARF